MNLDTGNGGSASFRMNQKFLTKNDVMIVLRILMQYGGSRSTVLICWTAGQQVK